MGRHLAQWLADAPADSLLYISELTRMACRVAPMRNRHDELLRRYDGFFSAPELRVLQLTRAVFEQATALRAVHALATPDALHLAAALGAGCDELWTNDKRLATASDGSLAVRPFGL